MADQRPDQSAQLPTSSAHGAPNGSPPAPSPLPTWANVRPLDAARPPTLPPIQSGEPIQRKVASASPTDSRAGKPYGQLSATAPRSTGPSSSTTSTALTVAGSGNAAGVPAIAPQQTLPPLRALSPGFPPLSPNLGQRVPSPQTQTQLPRLPHSPSLGSPPHPTVSLAQSPVTTSARANPMSMSSLLSGPDPPSSSAAQGGSTAAGAPLSTHQQPPRVMPPLPSTQHAHHHHAFDGDAAAKRRRSEGASERQAPSAIIAAAMNQYPPHHAAPPMPHSTMFGGWGPPPQPPSQQQQQSTEGGERHRQKSYDFARPPSHQPGHAHSHSHGGRLNMPGYWQPGATSVLPQPPSMTKPPGRPDYFTNDPQRGSEVGSHGHHHHYGQPQPQPPAMPPVTTHRKDIGGAGAWNKAFPPFQPSQPASKPYEANLPSASASSHKRKRSEMAEPLTVQPPPPPAPTPVPVPKRADGPVFTLEQAVKAKQTPSLLRVRSEAVDRSLSADTSPSLGRFVWSPDVDPSDLLDGQMLRNGVGGRVEVVVDARWLRGVGKWEVTDPSLALPDAATMAEADIVTTSEWSLWDLAALKRRKLWGTDVYTDDSDPLAMLLHAGWLRLGLAVGRSAADSVTAIEIVLRVAPKLVRYEGSNRAGITSRSWGNGHDGVSLVIESAKTVEAPIVRRRSRKASKPVLAAATSLDTFGFDASGKVVFGEISFDATAPAAVPMDL